MKNFLDRNLIIIDVESNGLYGQPFCVGAVLMDKGGRVISNYLGRCGIDEVEDEWVKENVLPALEDIKEEFHGLEGLQSTFINWYTHATDTSIEEYRSKPYTFTDIGFPVDNGFLIGLGKRRDHYGKMWGERAPYPLFDLGSILTARGVDPDISREQYAAPLIGIAKGKKHNPLWDAELTGLCVIRAMRPVPNGNSSDGINPFMKALERSLQDSGVPDKFKFSDEK